MLIGYTSAEHYSRGERIVSQLQGIGIRSRLQVMERGVFLKKMQGGVKVWPGTQIVFNATRIGGTWSNWYDSMFRCGGFNSKDFFCVRTWMTSSRSTGILYDRTERKKLAEQIQRSILENYYFVPVFRHAFHQRDRAAHRGTEMAGRVSDHHQRLCLSLGGHQGRIAQIGVP